jgi:hypothetical protein
MEKIRETQGLERVPRPCEHFDLIGGTSTGANCLRAIQTHHPTLTTCRGGEQHSYTAPHQNSCTSLGESVLLQVER